MKVSKNAMHPDPAYLSKLIIAKSISFLIAIKRGLKLKFIVGTKFFEYFSLARLLFSLNLEIFSIM